MISLEFITPFDIPVRDDYTYVLAQIDGWVYYIGYDGRLTYSSTERMITRIF